MPIFPASLKPIAGGFAPSIKSTSGGQSLSGFEQVGSHLSDRWMASYTFQINTDALVLAFRAFVLSMRGRANNVDLPAFDLARAPWALDAQGRKMTPAYARHPKLDGTIYADPPNLRESLIEAVVSEDVDLNGTSIVVDMVKGSAPQPGQLFSIGRRLYSILDVADEGPFTLTIWPWLREDVAAGAAVNFAAPICEMRFASDNEGVDALKSLSLMRFATVTLSFDEVPPITSERELREDGGYELRE
jgi:hypothetical protein